MDGRADPFKDISPIQRSFSCSDLPARSQRRRRSNHRRSISGQSSSSRRRRLRRALPRLVPPLLFPRQQQTRLPLPSTRRWRHCCRCCRCRRAVAGVGRGPPETDAAGGEVGAAGSKDGSSGAAGTECRKTSGEETMRQFLAGRCGWLFVVVAVAVAWWFNVVESAVPLGYVLIS